ncbi:MAG: type II and III secretion system protein, partial [Planctomycetes bacterium]|nr:type II and III secretion system protein [Planctomycetota bacterium]
RIRIGREMPISTTVATAATTTIDISYFFMGIVLNIKPRISRDQKEVSMQVEAIVSSRAPVKPLTHIVNGEELEVAPVIDSRIVQTFARVSNNTPFIIGGLIAHDVRKTVSGIPLLMDIPLLGWLFRTTTHKVVKNEVIVVLTPRVVPRKSESHFAVIPKDSESFEFLSDSKLFRNTYRIRQEDKFDLSFIYSNPRYKHLAGLAAQRANEDCAFADNPTVQSILDDHIPGERALMLRMLYEVVKRVENKIAGKKDQKPDDRLPTDNIILFQPRRQEGKDFEEVKVKRLATELKEMKKELKKTAKETGRALIIHYDLGTEADQEQLMPPLNISIVEAPKRSDYKNTMYELNVMKNDGTFESAAIVIQTTKDMARLKTCLILKKLLEINNFPEALRVSDFPVGMQILYPNLEDDTSHDRRMHVVDPNVAKLFYISDYYYKAFQQVYQAELDKLEELLEEE